MLTRSILAALIGALLAVPMSYGQAFTFTRIDVPDSTETWAYAIGPNGEIVGGYFANLDGRRHGYVLRNGTFTTVDVPGSLVGLGADVALETEVNAINPAGDMVGDYFAPPGAPGAPSCLVAYSPPCQRGFLFRRGQFYSILVPGHAGSIASGIAPDGSIYGCLHDQTFGQQMFGFARTHSGDFETLQAGGGELTSNTQSVPNSMNNGATPDASLIIGLYFPPGTTRSHGYTVRSGVLQDYMFPGSLATQIWGVNPGRDFVGLYRSAPGTGGVHGFLQPHDGAAPIAIDYLDPETGAAGIDTRAFGINPGGAIVGSYLDASGGMHGFLAVPVSD